MKYAYSLSLVLFGATPVLSAGAGPLDGADFVVNCVSAMNGGAVTIARSGETDKGFISTGEISGKATIIPGVNSLTFLHIQDQNVATFVVDFNDLSYDLSIKGPHRAMDHGACSEPVF